MSKSPDPNLTHKTGRDFSVLPDPDVAPLLHCLRLAEASVHSGGGPFGAMIVRDGLILARGWNQVTTTPDPTAHAEVQAIRRAAISMGDFRLQGATLYTSCEPCPLCLAAAYWARLDRIVFCANREAAAKAGFDDALFYQELNRPLEDRSLPMRQVPIPESNTPFEAWRLKDSRTNY